MTSRVDRIIADGIDISAQDAGGEARRDAYHEIARAVLVLGAAGTIRAIRDGAMAIPPLRDAIQLSDHEVDLLRAVSAFCRVADQQIGKLS